MAGRTGGQPPAESAMVLSGTAAHGAGKSSLDAEFAAFVTAESAALRRTAYFLCGDADRADELTQAALVRTYVAWRSARRGEPLAYARRVLANARIDAWRGRRRELTTDPASLPELPYRDGPPDDVDGDLLDALRKLSAGRRRVVVLRYVEGFSEAEVAQTLGISAGAVKSAASRGLAQLRRELSPLSRQGTGVHMHEEERNDARGR